MKPFERNGQAAGTTALQRWLREQAYVPETDVRTGPSATAFVKGLPLLNDHFYYVFDYTRAQVVEHGGFREVLGYADEDITAELVTGYFHPDDEPCISQIAQRAARLVIEADPFIRPFEVLLSLDYRVRKADGHYIKILRQTTMYEVDEERGLPISSISICRDISNIKHSDRIGWQWSGRDDLQLDFTDLVQGNSRLLYRPTAREMDIITRLAEGKSSRMIGEELFISAHTVNNHRRNLLNRMQFKNSAQLVKHATQQGWISG
ncbi:MAG: hypothetical protein H6590_08830 [Flavobacteriales bacterium]|nr:hypothetical protein [Flavobacteriales bacterium]